VAGTGGSARAVAAAAKAHGVRLLVRSRDPARAASFAGWARELGVDAHPDTGEAAATAINATPLGLKPGDPPPFPFERLDGCAIAFDLVYGPGETAWVRAARGLGLKAADGRVMLVAQGAFALERFFPGVQAPGEVMAAAVRRGLDG